MKKGSWARLTMMVLVVLFILHGRSWAGMVIAGTDTEGWDMAKIDTARNVPYLTDIEKDVILLVNKVRSNPVLFAQLYLTDQARYNKTARECSDQLLAMTPVEPLQPSKALSHSAADHAEDMGRTNGVGHTGTDGSSMDGRISRYGSWSGGIAENCSYGFGNAMGIVKQLLIDEGIESRGHRKNILKASTQYIGVAIRKHGSYRFNCVQDFAVGITEK